LSSDSGERRRQELMRKENILSNDLAVGLETALLPDELRAGIRQLDKNNHPKHSVLLPPRPSILPESSQVKYFSARITITG